MKIWCILCGLEIKTTLLTHYKQYHVDVSV